MDALVTQFKDQKVEGDFLIYALYFYDIMAPQITVLKGPLIHKSIVKDSYNMEFTKLSEKLQQIIPFIHIESIYFNARVFLEAFHPKESSGVYQQTVGKIRKFTEEFKNEEESILVLNGSRAMRLQQLNQQID